MSDETYDHETVAGRTAAFLAWSEKQKRRLGPFAGLSLRRTNVGSWTFGRHWPHLLCWDWTIDFGPWQTERHGPRRLVLHRLASSRQVHLDMWLFRASFLWQDYQTMAALGPVSEAAPVIHRRSRQRQRA